MCVAAILCTREELKKNSPELEVSVRNLGIIIIIPPFSRALTLKTATATTSIKIINEIMAYAYRIVYI